jgi:16S rRNA (guanine527-N7)-methyltransferase
MGCGKAHGRKAKAAPGRRTPKSTSMEVDDKVEILLKTLESQSRNYGINLTAETAVRLGLYYQLLNKWNARLHLVAPCSPEEFATRHLLESLFLVKSLPLDAKIVDVGSGGGLPVIPCLIARKDLSATLIESSKRKSVFLREALKQSNISAGTTVLSDRFENLPRMSAQFLTCRALDGFEEKLPDLIRWSPESSTLVLYGGDSLRQKLTALSTGFSAELLPNSDRRFLFVVQRR